MKGFLIVLLCCTAMLARAQVNFRLGAGSHLVVSGYSEVVVDTGILVNDGTYTDTSGMFRALGGITFAGTGTTDFYYLVVDNAQTSLVDAPVSVHNTANLTSGYLDANSKLHLRSDLSPVANMEVYGVLENHVLGLVTRATVLSGCDPFVSNLSLNISGTAMQYQWQLSADSVTWTDIYGATNGTHAANVTSIAFYRCWLTTNNSSYSQATPGVKLELSMGDITGDSLLCVGTSSMMSSLVAGGVWSSSAPSVVTVGSSTGIITGVSNGTATITYTAGSGCYRIKQVTVGLPAITGTTNICIGSTSTLVNPVAGGVWSSASPYYASVDAATGVVTGVHVGTTTISYTVSSGCYVTTTVNMPNIALSISGGLVSCPGKNTTLVSPGYPGGSWTTSDVSVATVNATTGVMLGVGAGTTVVTYTYAYCFKTAIATVNPSPLPVTGSSAVCIGNTIAMSCGSTGGAWSSNVPARASVDAAGVVTGMASGTARISYTISTGCASYQVVTVGAMPLPISGTAVICEGSSTTLLCNPGGGTWTTADAGTATVTPVSAVTCSVTGVAAGITTVSYTSVYGCVRTYAITVNPTPGPISGTLTVCDGSTTTLTAGTSGGTWVSGAIGVATVGSSSGIVTGYTAGTANISYRLAPSCYAVAQVTVDAPAAISGASGVCVGAATTLTHPATGGTWMSSNTARATVDPVTGTVTGIAPGYVNIIYVLTPTCHVVKPFTVNNNPTPILGPASVCEGANIVLFSSAGGVWSIADTTVATNSANVVTGISAGTTLISYVVTSTGCYATRALTVNDMPSAITGPNAICVGDVSVYASSPTGGTWTSNAPTVGSVDAATGAVTGRAGGSATIRYTLPGGCFTVKPITVNALPAGITGIQTFCVGNSVTLTSTTSGSTWSLSDSSVVAVVSVTPTAINLSGATAGNTVLSYTNANGCSRIASLTVNAAVAPLSGADSVCSANSVLFSCATSGGTWMSSATAKATVGAGTGLVTGYATGTANISYTVSAGCKVWKTITVLPAMTAIAGVTNICQGSSTTFLHAVSGGTWSAATPSIATVAATTGVVTGASAGTGVISYHLSEGCYKTKPITIKVLPSIAGTSTLVVGSIDSFSASPAGGAWATAASGIANVNGYGVVSGIAVGITTISYTAAGCVSAHAIEITPSSSLRPNVSAYEDSPGFSVFPNPSHGVFSVRSEVAGTFVVYTIDGKEVLVQDLSAGTSTIVLPAGLAQGMYVGRFSCVGCSGHAVVLSLEL
jgi:trimeric autotransporter adhesin